MENSWNKDKGTSLVELMVSAAISVGLVMAGGILYTRVDAFSRKTRVEALAESEAQLFLTILRKTYNTDIINKQDRSRLMVAVDSTALASGGTGGSTEGNSVISTTTSFVLESQGQNVTVFRYGNRCTPIPPALRGVLPSLSEAYIRSIFIREQERYQRGEATDDPMNCFLNMRGFQCGLDETSYVELDNAIKSRMTRLPQDISPGGTWSSTSQSAVAAFMCVVDPGGGDLRQFKDVSVFVGTYDALKADADIDNRLKWERHRLIIAPLSTSPNVQTCSGASC